MRSECISPEEEEEKLSGSSWKSGKESILRRLVVVVVGSVRGESHADHGRGGINSHGRKGKLS